MDTTLKAGQDDNVLAYTKDVALMKLDSDVAKRKLHPRALLNLGIHGTNPLWTSENK